MTKKRRKRPNAHMNVGGRAGHHELDSDPEEAASLYMAFAVKIKA